MQKYIVTLYNRDDLETFYNEMESGSLLGRKIECTIRRPLSRNTHYLLMEEEVAQLKLDSRVRDVQLEMAIFPNQRIWTQSGVWSKSVVDNATYDNWGIYRSILENNITDWGSNDPIVQDISATLNISGTGKNVDVIIIDGHFNPAHPEFAVNANGSGGSRVNQINWNLLTSEAENLDDDSVNGLTSTYVYTPYIDPGNSTRTDDNDHGCHVAGTVAGNTQGWARDANIYNINPYASNPNYNTSFYLIMWDYIRAFHKTKAINADTGLKNPTICNASYGNILLFPYAPFSIGSITSVNYRGTLTTGGPFTDTQLTNWGLYVVSPGVVRAPIFYTSIAADVEDAIADGIIVIGAAGNDYNTKIDVFGGIDYNNYITANVDGVPTSYYYNRGLTPTSVDGVITVGALSSLKDERKAIFSNSGPRIDLWAPGQNIQSSVHTGGNLDPRNPSFRLEKKNGTSMASPQVTGVLACLLETYPRMKPQDAKELIVAMAKSDKLTNGTNDYDLQDSPNKLLYYDEVRKKEGAILPTNNFGVRKTNGQLYPRSKILRYGS